MDVKMEIKKVTSEFAERLLTNGKMGKFEPIGKYWVKEDDVYTGIDNSTGDAWTEDFKTKEECIGWLTEGEKEYDFSCWKCDNKGDYTVSIYIEFIDGTDYYELIGEYEEEEITPYIKEVIKERNWEGQVKEYSYGYYCPHCLESLE